MWLVAIDLAVAQTRRYRFFTPPLAGIGKLLALAGRYFLELYTAVLPAVFSVSVFCWYQICWIFGISVGIDPPLFCILPPFPPEKGGHCPLFDTEMYRPNFPSVSVW